MAQETWHYQQNQFDNATEGSFKKMNILNADHFGKLQALQGDPDIAALLARTTPLHDAYNLRYSRWLSAKATYKGRTSQMEEHINNLSLTKSKEWDAQIQVVHLEGTPNYIAILPDGRKPFYSGTIDDKISHLQSLAQRLVAYPALAATMNDVLAFHTTIDNARDVQQQKEELVHDASDLLETARKNIALMMYRNLGFLIDKYGSAPEMISNFWELQLLRAAISDDEQTVSGKTTNAANGNPLPHTKVTVKDADGVQVGESVFTDENGQYITGTEHIGPGTIEFEEPTFVTVIKTVNVPKGGSLVQDAALQPKLQSPAPPQT